MTDLVITCFGAHIICRTDDENPVKINGVPYRFRLDFSLQTDGTWKASEGYQSLHIDRTDEKRWSVEPTQSARSTARMMAVEAVQKWVRENPALIAKSQADYRSQFALRCIETLDKLKAEIERVNELLEDANSLSIVELSEKSGETYAAHAGRNL